MQAINVVEAILVFSTVSFAYCALDKMRYRRRYGRLLGNVLPRQIGVLILATVVCALLYGIVVVFK